MPNPTEAVRTALIYAKLALEHNPIPEERKRIIGLCDTALALLPPSTNDDSRKGVRIRKNTAARIAKP